MSSKYFQGNRGNITAAIWLIGLGILALTDQWWPGILILIGLSMVARAVLPADEESPRLPRSRNDEDDYSYLEEPLTGEDDPHPPVAETPLQVRVADPEPSLSSDLPSSCPMCGAPVAARKVKRNPSGAPLCSYCGADLNT